MLHGIVLTTCSDRRIGVGAAVGVDQQRVTLSIVLTILEVLWHVHLAAVGGASFADRNRLGDDVTRGIVSEVHHFSAGVLVLAVVGKCDGQHFAAGAFALQDHAWILHGET